MAWPEVVVLVRHAESKGNVLSADERAECDVGTHKYGITSLGDRQAEITGGYLNDEFPEGFDAYYSSYYIRTKQTMRKMFPDAKIYEDPRLAEAQRGIWHVMTQEQVEKSLPFEVIRKEREGLYHYRPIGGENWPDVELRIHSFLGTLFRDYGGKKVMMVVHGHWLILFQRLIEHFSIEEAVARYNGKVYANASVTIYRGVQGSNGQSRLVLDRSVVPWEGKLEV